MAGLLRELGNGFFQKIFNNKKKSWWLNCHRLFYCVEKGLLMQLFNDDAPSVLKALPDNSIDLIATDPPYFRSEVVRMG